MGAKFLSNVPFLGKDRKAGDRLTDEELSMLTPQSKDALVAQRILEIDGQAGPAGPSMSAADMEAIRALSASFDKFRETMLKSVVELHGKLDSLGASAPKKPKAARAAKTQG